MRFISVRTDVRTPGAATAAASGSSRGAGCCAQGHFNQGLFELLNELIFS